MAGLFPGPPSPKKQCTRSDLPSLTLSPSGRENADGAVFNIKAPTVTNNKAKLIAVLVPGQGLFVGGTAFYELTQWLKDVVSTLFMIAKKYKVDPNIFTRPNGTKYPYAMNGYLLNDLSTGMVWCFAVWVCQAVLLTDCMLLTNDGLLPAIEAVFLDRKDPDFKGVGTNIDFRALKDGERMLEFCIKKIIECKMVKDENIAFLNLFGDFRISSTANVDLKDYQAKYDAIKDHPIYKTMNEELKKKYNNKETVYFTPFFPCETTLFEFFFALLPKN